MKEYLNTTFVIKKIDSEKYDMLLDFLEDNDITFHEENAELFVIDERTEEDKYNDWLGEQADNYNDLKYMDLI